MLAPKNSKTLVQTAIELGEFSRLLMGEPEYCYLAPGSPSPWNTDLTVLLDVVYDCDDSVLRSLAKRELSHALPEVVRHYRGLVPVAICLLLELAKKARGRDLGLPVAELACVLRKNIETHGPRLSCDYAGGGAQWPDGVLGELRRLSSISVELGGPSFCG